MLKGRHFLTLSDFENEEISALLTLSAELKDDKRRGRESQRLTGQNIALIFEKLSTRTRCAFEVAAYDQGARVTYIGASGSHMGEKESMRDTARVLGRMYDGIEYRGHGQSIVEELAAYAGVPVWNGLTDEFHPTQVIADFQTMLEHYDRPLNRMRLAYVGDARNNTAYSLLVGAAKMGLDFRIGAPRNYWPKDDVLEEARRIACSSDAALSFHEDPRAAVADADFVYTDVWLSLGEPDAKWAERIDALLPFQVNRELMQATGNSDAKFMHCLPAFHDAETQVGRRVKEEFGLDSMEVTNEVFESGQSVVFDQAENRMHSIKAILVATLAGL
ncbi:MAG: ornithine carbamoyltransferase [Pseudomonadota bacterium]